MFPQRPGRFIENDISGGHRGTGLGLPVGKLHLQLILDVKDPITFGLVEAASRGGVDSIQVRSKGLAVGRLLPRTVALIDALKDASPRPFVVVNDRVDVALMAGADGVHLPETSFRPEWVPRLRELGGGMRFVVGRSIHGPDGAEVGGTEQLDYVLFGHVFDSASKPGIEPRGLHALAHTARRSPVPVLAVGGITADTIAQVIGAGAMGVAVISAICAASDPYAATLSLRRALDACES